METRDVERSQSSHMSGLPSMEKLDGSTNYGTWKFQMELHLIHEDLWEYTATTPSATDVQGIKKDQKARAKICLTLKPHCLIHVRQSKTAKECWDALCSTFEDRGVNNRCYLLGKLVSQKLSMYESSQKYVTEIMSIAQKLNDIGKELDDELLAALMLQGLGEKYAPLRMAMENSNIVLTTDYVKMKLLQLEKKEQGDNEEPSTSALVSTKTNFSKNRNKQQQKILKCFICKGHHKAINCPSNPSKKKTNNNGHQVNFTALSTTESSSKGEWILDSGASSHMTCRKDLFRNYVELEKPVQVTCANGSRINGEGRGDVCSTRELEFTVSEALYVPDLTVNLLSVSTLVNRGIVVVFSKRGCEMYTENDCEIKGSGKKMCEEERGIYKFRSKPCTYNSYVSALNTIADNSFRLWHQRLGHLSFNYMKILRDEMAEGINFKDPEEVQCVSCLKGKQTKLPFPKKKAKRATEILELVHSDVCGPIETPSFSGKRYFITFIDDKTRKTFVYFLREKSEVFSVLVEFKILAESQTGRKLKIIRTDNGTEYVNKRVSEFLKQNGIVHQLTVDYTPAQNGVSERANRTIVERARSMLAEANLPKVYWAEAVQTSVFLKNRSPTLAVKGKTPEEAWTGRKINLSFLRIFGSKAYMHIPDEKRKKLYPKSLELVFVGYFETTKGYRLLDPKTHKVYKSRDVVFFENSKDIDTSKNEERVVEEVIIPLGNIEEPDVQDIPTIPEIPISSEEVIQMENDIETREEPGSGVIESNPETEMENVDEGRRYPLRERTPTVFKDCILYHTVAVARDEPLTIEEALSREDSHMWRAAIQEELKALKKNNTWTLVKPPERKCNIVDSKWLFRIKEEAGGKRYKARLVARGFSQRRGIDYFETFAPVVRHSSLRLLIALTAKLGLHIDQMDVKTAFLNGHLEEEVYMNQPKGFEEQGDYICRLNRALYGLKQAPRAWNKRLNETLEKLGFHRSKNESCVYYRGDKQKIIILAVYVDDILIFWNEEQEMKKVKEELTLNFEMKDLGSAKLMLGINITQEKDGISLDQEDYIGKLLHAYGMEAAKPVTTPSVQGQRLEKPGPDHVSPNVPYQALIGSLLYVAVCTRPDIAHTVNSLSQFNECYDDCHWIALKRVLRYLKGTKSLKLKYSREAVQREWIVGYADADHAGDRDRRSYSGSVFLCQGGAICWNSQKQKTIALSTAEAEYVSLSEAAKEAVFLRRFMAELTRKPCEAITLYTDSQSAMAIAQNPVHHQRTKHIDVRYQFIREAIENGEISLIYKETSRMVADVLTKGLMRGGNQRDLARAKNQKKQQEQQKKKNASEKTGLSLTERKHRDAELMREKQRKKEEQSGTVNQKQAVN
ncbi:uncharacterized protein [Maniola hyperantus]|uniref:uncharacterized protein n=1 Tax=Aphantopus hyperantus TaxID=2795564 RepID=UPI0037484775